MEKIRRETKYSKLVLFTKTNQQKSNSNFNAAFPLSGLLQFIDSIELRVLLMSAAFIFDLFFVFLIIFIFIDLNSSFWGEALRTRMRPGLDLQHREHVSRRAAAVVAAAAAAQVGRGRRAADCRDSASC